MVTVPARPYIVIPAALRHRCGLGAGDHVLLAAVPGQNIYVIRTRRIPFFRSRPSLPMMLVPTAAAAIGIVLPFTGLSHVLGFTPLPATFFLVLVVLIVAYMALVDVAKALFYREHGARPAVPSAQPPISRAQPVTDPRSVRRFHRRAAPFTAHALTGPGRWFLRPDGSDGKDMPTSAAAGSDNRTGAINH